MKGRGAITLVCIGRLRDAALRDVAADYEKRIGRYSSFEVVEVPHERVTRGKRATVESLRRSFGAARVRVALDVSGKAMDSVGFARLVEKARDLGGGLSFLIGGPEGIPADLLEGATKRVSFSRLTFPHELFRTVFLEQLYRAFTIIRGEPYHK